MPVVLLALTGLLWPATASAQAPEPSLRLVAPRGPVTLDRFKGRVALDLGVWVAATGGDFELRVVRPDYDSPAAVKQVDADTGDVLRTLPSTTLDGWLGFSRFVTVVVKGPGGKTFRQVRYTWCPNGWDRQRVDDSGPELPRYPAFCGSSLFTKGMVWGIESGWATSALGGIDSGAPSIRLPRAGKLLFEVRIARPYPALFDIAAEDAQVTLDVTVRNVRQQPCCEEGRAGRSAVAAPARSQAVPDVDDPDPSTVPDLVALPLWSMTTFRTKRRDSSASLPLPGMPDPPRSSSRDSGSGARASWMRTSTSATRTATWSGALQSGRWRSTRIPAQPLAFPPVRPLHTPQRVRPRGRSQPKAGLLPRADGSNRPHARAGELLALGRSEHELRIAERSLGAGGAPDGMGGHILPGDPGPVVRHHNRSERLVLRQARGQSVRSAPRGNESEQRRVPSCPPRRAAGPSYGARRALARHRGLITRDQAPPSLG
jgi:hypothetical protein